MPLSVSEGGGDDDPVDACWADGSKIKVAQVTVKMLREIHATRSSQEHAPLWQGTHVGDHHSLVLRQRADRHLLLSLYEQTKQIAQFRVSHHGDIKPEDDGKTKDNTEPAVVACAAWARPYAEKYASGEIKEPSDLKKAIRAGYKALQQEARAADKRKSTKKSKRSLI